MSVRQIMLTLLRLNTEQRARRRPLRENSVHSVSSVHSVFQKNLNYFPAVSEIASLSWGIEGILSESSALCVENTHHRENSQTQKLTNLKTHKLTNSQT